MTDQEGRGRDCHPAATTNRRAQEVPRLADGSHLRHGQSAGRTNPATGELSVYRFFANGKWELVERFADREMAVRTATALTDSVSAKIGLTSRVIIMDDMGFTSFEWIRGRGLVFPTPDMSRK